ncbi:MAG TPA: glycosyltransferase family 4 protein [Methylomirabilota bacterium]|jgi:glycosyltransferase involved in cell wall biosynthesis
MRVLYFGTLPPHPGGTAFVAAQIVPALARRGHRVVAVAPMAASALSQPDTFAAENPAIEVRRYPVPFFDIVPGLALNDDYVRAERQGLSRLLPDACRRLRPDVVLIGRESFVWHLPAIPDRLTPTAVIVHGGSTFEALVRESSDKADVLRKLFTSTNLLIAVAAHAARELETVGLWHNKVIPNPVDVRMFRPQPTNGLRKTLGLQEEDVVVVHTSNLKPIKRPLDLVQLAAMNPDPRLRYVVVGDGPLRAEMERECGARRVSERFRFVGWVAHERVPAFLNLADMVVMPSESEGQALVHLETQACGRLLIASDTPGAREVVRHGETGLLFEKGNVGELAAATAMAAANPMLRQRIGRNAERAVQAHALDVIAAEYEAALRDLIR